MTTTIDDEITSILADVGRSMPIVEIANAIGKSSANERIELRNVLAELQARGVVTLATAGGRYRWSLVAAR